MILITSGCSFSLTSQNTTGAHPSGWPDYLFTLYFEKLISKAMGSQGNGLISRGIIYEVSKQLKEYHSDDIRVGIMWSGTDRYQVYSEDPLFENIDGWVENPTGFIDNYKNWQILNYHWESQKSNIYYKNFHTAMYGWIQTLENILRTQWFLEKYNIKYFMTTFMNLFKGMPDTEETKHLWRMIDWDKFLPIEGMYEWCDKSELDNSNHPTQNAHEKFVKEIIIPFGFK